MLSSGQNPHIKGTKPWKRWEAQNAAGNNVADGADSPAAAAPAPIKSDSRRMGEWRAPQGPGTNPDVYDPDKLDVAQGYHANKIQRNIMKPGRGAGV
jgi:hypothetical protein